MGKRTKRGRVGDGPVATGLADTMQDVYAAAAAARREQLLASAPVVLALFDGAGGRMCLRTPGRPVAHAPSVPAEYRQLKGLAHAPVAVFELAAAPVPAAGEPSAGEPSARFTAAMAHGTRDQVLSGLGPEDARIGRTLLGLCDRLLARLDSGTRAHEADAARFARACAPLVLHLVERAAAVQVGHWTAVLDRWQKRLGGSFEGVYAAANTLYVTRCKNVLFTILAQYLGEEAIGERLFLFETPEFTTSPDRMLDLLTRVVTDRELGRAFFGNGRIMDVELMGDAARDAVRREMARRGRKAALPTVAPYDTHQWPWATDPLSGTGPGTLAAARPGG
ncbi:hypothetical protein ACIQ9E_25440 [Streptomyces sp. NPDC094448]|uniref:hypothetical protein n=1 Tax=Streptomyces sp. NPDC094448 TaxID=3366063 RepID=UPI00382F3D55